MAVSAALPYLRHADVMHSNHRLLPLQEAAPAPLALVQLGVDDGVDGAHQGLQGDDGTCSRSRGDEHAWVLHLGQHYSEVLVPFQGGCPAVPQPCHAAADGIEGTRSVLTNNPHTFDLWNQPLRIRC
jgi:hypothetical protein